jgi:uncharacterized protein YoxC
MLAIVVLTVAFACLCVSVIAMAYRLSKLEKRVEALEGAVMHHAEEAERLRKLLDWDLNRRS